MKELEDLYAKILAAVADDDDEVAHSYEDKLRERALELIADEPPSCDAAYIAKFALKSSKLGFARWCA